MAFADKYRSPVSARQRNAITGNRDNVYDPYAEARAELERQMALVPQREQRRQYEKNLAMQKEMQGKQADAAKASGISNLAGTGLQAAMLYKYLKPTPAPVPGAAVAGTDAAATGTDAVLNAPLNASESLYGAGGVTPQYGVAASEVSGLPLANMTEADLTLNAAGGQTPSVVYPGVEQLSYQAPGQATGVAAASTTAAPTTAAPTTAAPQASGGMSGVAAPLAYIAAAELVKNKWGGMDKKWEDRSGTQRTVSAPGTGGIFPGSTMVDPDTAYGKFGGFMAKAEQKALAPIDKIFGIDNEEGTWLCTATDNAVGLTNNDRLNLLRLRQYALKAHDGWMQAYLDEGPVLIAAIAKREGNDVKFFYENLTKTFIDPCITLVQERRMEEAYQLYADVTTELFKEYAPEIEIKEHIHAFTEA